MSEDGAWGRTTVPDRPPFTTPQPTRRRIPGMFQIHLLGIPSVSDSAGVARTPRGRKTWAMVAYLMLSELPPSRKRLAELFHSEAADPLGALRWTLADARRLLSPAISIDGDPVTIQVGSSTTIDVTELASSAVGDMLASATLLDGLEFRDAPYLQGWLDLERYRVQAEVCSFILEAALTALAADESEEAVRLSERLVDIDPLEERHHAMLVRALIGAGNTGEADMRAAAGSSLLLTTLGVEHTTLIDTAKAVGIKDDLTSSHSIRALIEAGRAAMGAGVPDGALRTLGSALRDARASGDAHVL